MQWGQFKFNPVLWGSGLIMVFFLTLALTDLWNYLRLAEQTEAHVDQWKIVEIAPSQYGIKAKYTFEVGGQVYQGKTFFSKPYYLNFASAEKRVKDFGSRKWRAWYQPRHPQITSLERRFPTKSCLYAFITIGVFIHLFYRLELSNSR